MANPYHQQSNVRFVGTFVNAGGTLIDPAAVTLTLYPARQLHGIIPGTVVYTYTSGSITQQSTGSYTYDMSPIPSGTYGVWTQQWAGSNPNIVFTGQVFVYQEPR